MKLILLLTIFMVSAPIGGIPKATQAIKPPKKGLVFLDGIKAVFRGSEGTDLIMFSELHRPKLDGSAVTFEDILKDLALAQEAKKYRLWPSPEEIDKQLNDLRNEWD